MDAGQLVKLTMHPLSYWLHLSICGVGIVVFVNHTTHTVRVPSALLDHPLVHLYYYVIQWTRWMVQKCIEGLVLGALV